MKFDGREVERGEDEEQGGRDVDRVLRDGVRAALVRLFHVRSMGDRPRDDVGEREYDQHEDDRRMVAPREERIHRPEHRQRDHTERSTGSL